MAGPKKAKKTIRPRVRRRSVVSGRSGVAQLKRQLAEARAQQAATAAILKIIASSPSDVQPVFDTIARSAQRLFSARYAAVTRRVDDMLHLVAHTATGKAGAASLEKLFPAKLTGQGAVGKAVLSGKPAWIIDVETDPAYSPVFRASARTRGYRSQLTAPMIRKGISIGAITVTRREPGAFSAHQIGLLQTFADQAVIAIENVRLFNETKEALEQQTATAEILKVISNSPTDTRPVFEAIVKTGLDLFGGMSVGLLLVAGDHIVRPAHALASEVGVDPAEDMFPLQLDEKSFSGRAVLRREIVHVPDIDEYSGSTGRKIAERMGFQAGVFAPMMREGKGIGAIGVLRAQKGPFTDKQIALLKTFADQAVIAIENVRLFNETKEALERQTATAEVLNVISSSPTDVQPVFDAIARSGKRLCNARECGVFRFDGELIHLVALAEVKSAWSEALRGAFPSAPSRTSITSRAILARAVVQVPDILADPDYLLHEAAQETGIRSVLSVPLVRDGQVVGAITVDRTEPAPFLDKQVSLLQTFADQAVIAIENVRLFNETKESLERQTATAEILKVISSSPTDEQPVFDAIVASAERLFAGRQAFVRILDGENLVRRAGRISSDDILRFKAVPVDRDSIVGKALLDCGVLEVADTLGADATEFAKKYRGKLPYRAICAAPLLREGKGIGVITVTSQDPGAMPEKQKQLLQTFADQAVIAIENVRLFKELQSRTEALTKSVGQLTALGEVGQAISSTLDLETVLRTIVARAVQLAGLDGGAIYEYDEQAEEFRLQAAENVDAAVLETVRKTPIRKGDGATGRTAITLEAIQVPDIQDDSYHGSRKDNLVRTGYRAILAVPLLREDHLLGALQVFRRTPGPFADEVVELLKTFATQSAMAIQNARLFREIGEKGKQLEVASRHKSEFLANMSHELRTPLNAIIGFSEVLRERMFGEINEKQADYLKDIHESGRHLLSLINDILDLSKIEAGRMDLELSSFHMPGVISNAMTLLRERAQRHGITLASEIDPRLGEFTADERKVKQILVNLLSNAVKFTADGGRVDVSARLNGKALEIAVKDTGIGIAAEDHAAVFEEFKQVGRDYTRKAEGTGLGLALTKRFVELHGGTIRLESAPGTGSTFSFNLPGRP